MNERYNKLLSYKRLLNQLYVRMLTSVYRRSASTVNAPSAICFLFLQFFLCSFNRLNLFISTDKCQVIISCHRWAKVLLVRLVMHQPMPKMLHNFKFFVFLHHLISTLKSLKVQGDALKQKIQQVQKSTFWVILLLKLVAEISKIVEIIKFLFFFLKITKKNNSNIPKWI